MKYKLIKSNTDKKAFIYRIQSVEQPLWMSYFSDFNGFYLSIPNEIVKDINKHIAECIDPKYIIKIEDNKYDTTSTGVKMYGDILKYAQASRFTRLQDIVLRFNEYTFGKKHGLSKTITEGKFAEMEQSYMVSDDYFDEVDADCITSRDTATENNPMPIPTQEMPPMPTQEPTTANTDETDDLPF